MRLVNPRLPLAVGCCLLVASIFSPFATEFGYLIVFPDPGPYTDPQLANRVTFWSFMHIQEVNMTRIDDRWVATSVQWLVFAEYWDWWGSGQSHILPSSILIPMFILQTITVLLGLTTLLKANTARKILPLLLAVMALSCLYLAGCHILQSEVFIGFWLSIPSIAAILTAMVMATLDARACCSGL